MLVTTCRTISLQLIARRVPRFGSCRFSLTRGCTDAIQQAIAHLPSINQIRGRPFQFAFDGVLFPFSHARPALPVLFKFAKRHGQRTPAEFVPLKADRHACTPLKCIRLIGAYPLWTAYSVHSPLFLPDPQSRGRPCQYAPDGASPPSSHARPAKPALTKCAKRHGQRTPAEPAP